MSMIFAQLQMAELERNEQQTIRPRLLVEPESIAVDVDEFSALEDRVIRAVEVVKRERQNRIAAEERALKAEAELQATKGNSELGRQRIQHLMNQLDAVLA